MTNTAGQTFTTTIRRYMGIGPRTLRYRDGDLIERMLENVEHAAFEGGYHSERTESALRPAIGPVMAYRKHVQGYRIDGMTAGHIRSLTPWQFAAFLGQMVDAGITNTGEGERFFRSLAA